MKNQVISLQDIMTLVKPLAEKYHVKELYLFGSYARGEADAASDLDFLVFGGDGFKLTYVLALGEELREVLQKKWMYLKFEKSIRIVNSIKRL